MATVDLSQLDSFFFDCDGVIWLGNQPIPGSIATLNHLHSLGKRIYFVTNNPALSQAEIAQKITDLGYKCEERQVFGNAKGTGVYIRRRYPSIRKVYLIGQMAQKREMESLGLRVVHNSEFSESSIKSLEQLKSLRPDADIEAVIVSTQMSFNYLAAYYGSICVQRGAKLIGTARDCYFILKEGVRMPGCGTLLTFLENATGKQGELVGKPSPFFMEWAQDSEGVEPKRTLMVGDSLVTDIQFANNVGMASLLVLSGVTKAKDVTGSLHQPTYTLNTLADLIAS
jgi:phosphoglycolate/pyridoxal phosphate phosphatase family enzyme